ncbi:hypothetical protein C8R44DRAFT_875281 [Mycena epipterygia]|nr:hypothetical protein C8R44DRAFT_875281 [Mycena epipterygia]
MHASSPLAIQEIADSCISLLQSPSDLRACALVSRSWVYAAQAELFRVVRIGTDRMWSKLYTALIDSQYLIRHILKLEVFSTYFSSDTFSALANFPFTHVSHLFAVHRGAKPALVLQQLISLPTLRRVQLELQDVAPSDFASIWNRCPSSLRHLDIYYDCAPDRGENPFRPIQREFAPVQLDSLHLISSYLVGWFIHDLCPFDLSRLKALSLQTDHFLRSPRLRPVLCMIETLDLSISSHSIDARHQSFDLSMFPNLARVRIRSYSRLPLPDILQILSTIKNTNHIHTIVVGHVTDVEDVLGALADKCMALPMRHTPTLELDLLPSQVNLIPQLSALNITVCPMHTTHSVPPT